MANKNKKRKKEMLSEEIRQIIVDMFEKVDEALSVAYILGVLKSEQSYLVNPEDIIRDAIEDGLIYVDTIKDDGTVYLGLGAFGESRWRERYGWQ